MLENRHFFVELGGKKSRWRRLRNGLPQGSVLAPLLFNIYTNDQPKSVDTRRFISADDLGMGAQATDFKTVEDRLSNALAELTPYYEENHLRAKCSPSKTQLYACPVWERAAHAKKLDPALNASCRIITGCLKSTPTDRLYILAGIAPPEIRRNAASKKERQQQSTDQRHPLFGHVPKAALNPGEVS
ncbi:hypothetical protein KUCAC02_002926 [Chaenocephalus aceratus]|uniref:Uncharacterized protein n=1 Tax=Chaenocephalus aceratus TaxID=36190 RepID=A0ACB9WKV3_CHAAC|nr:hypothetical protein KUCAC02_002926 [Chaenocephalus aceratus]